MKKLLLFFVLSLFTRHAFAAPGDLLWQMNPAEAGTTAPRSVSLGRDNFLIGLGSLFAGGVEQVSLPSFQQTTLSPPDLELGGWIAHVASAKRRNVTALVYTKYPPNSSIAAYYIRIFHENALTYEAPLSELGSSIAPYCSGVYVSNAGDKVVAVCQFSGYQAKLMAWTLSFNASQPPLIQKQTPVDITTLCSNCFLSDMSGDGRFVAVSTQRDVMRFTQDSSGAYSLSQQSSYFFGGNGLSTSISDNGAILVTRPTQGFQGHQLHFFPPNSASSTVIAVGLPHISHATISDDGTTVGIATNTENTGFLAAAFRIDQQGTPLQRAMYHEWFGSPVNIGQSTLQTYVHSIHLSKTGERLIVGTSGNNTDEIPHVVALEEGQPNPALELQLPGSVVDLAIHRNMLGIVYKATHLSVAGGVGGVELRSLK